MPKIVAARLSVNSFILIIANSGRMLAEAAQRAGYQVLVIDRFADVDTVATAHAVWRVESLTLLCLQQAIVQIPKHYAIEHLVVGSGFGNYIDSLAWLESQFTLLGNGGVIVSTITNPVTLYQTLERLQITHPETHFQAPETTQKQWLIKPYASEGGLNIKFYHEQAVSQNHYWQRYLQGSVYSALFVGNGVDAQLLALNQQWTTTHQDGQAFVFSGLIQSSDANLWPHHKTITNWIKKLTLKFALIGLNGLDFIIHEGRCWLLEVNPRAPASMMLYQQEDNLFNVHMNACHGILPCRYLPQSIPVPAYQIIYTSARLIIPVDFKWPDWTADQAKPGTIIDTDQAICSIIASACNAKSVLKLLQYRSQTLYQLLIKKGAFSTCNIQPALINYPSL